MNWLSIDYKKVNIKKFGNESVIVWLHKLPNLEIDHLRCNPLLITKNNFGLRKRSLLKRLPY